MELTIEEVAYGPREQNVYHNHSICTDGKKIKPEHITWGPGVGRRVYEICQAMQ